MKTVRTKKCSWCKKEGTLELTEDQLERARQWGQGLGPIQQMLPDLTPDQREQLMTGTHPECWKAMWDNEEGASADDHG